MVQKTEPWRRRRAPTILVTKINKRRRNWANIHFAGSVCRLMEGATMSELEHNEVSPQAPKSDAIASPSRRTFLKGVAGAGAAVSLISNAAWADGEIGYWAKDLPNDKLTEMFNTIVRIRWYERTMVDKMITDPKFRGYNHFYPGQEAVATGVCADKSGCSPFDQLDVVYSTHRPSGHAIAKGVDMKKMAAEYDFRANGFKRGVGEGKG